MQNQIIRLPEVKRATSLSRSNIYRQIAAKKFPAPISLGVRARGWLVSDIQKWIQSRVELSGASVAGASSALTLSVG